MGYHYESHTTTTDYLDGTQTRSSVIVRELDEGEVGILLAGNNSIMDPSLTPRMLSVPTTDYDVESAALSPAPEQDTDDIDVSDEDEEEHWFPSLRHNSWIEGLEDNDSDDIMMDNIMENLFATAVLEKDDDERQPPKAKTDDRGTTRQPSGQQQSTSKRTQSGSRLEQLMNEDDNLVELVPVDIIYVVVND